MLKSNRFIVFLTVFALCLMSFSSAFAAEGNENSSSNKWNVSIGKMNDSGVSLDSMFPNVIYVHEGDQITFSNKNLAPHTVTFLAGETPVAPTNPKAFVPTAETGVEYDGKSFFNSGIVPPQQSFDMTFTESGVYPYYCILHPMMRGTVVVLPEDAPIPTEKQQEATAKALEVELNAEAKVLAKASDELKYSLNEDGSITYKVKMGVGSSEFTVNRNFPEHVVVNEGDSVEWLNENHYEMHFVTFNKPEGLQMEVNGGLNPEMMAPSGGHVFDGEGFYNSGAAFPHQNYKLKFVKPGTYKYECYLHSGDKMVGTVTVLPKNSLKVFVNNELLPVIAEKRPHFHDGHVFASIKEFTTALGGTAAWNSEKKAVNVNIGGQYDLPKEFNGEGLNVAINGKELTYALNKKPHSHNGTSYAPLNEMVRLLDGSYSWDETTKTMHITIGSKHSMSETPHHDMAASNEIVINIENMKFDQQELTVKKGTTVTWVNKDNETHDVTEQGYQFSSGNMNAEDTWSFTFNDIGDFEYFCTLHPQMVGKITVVE